MRSTKQQTTNKDTRRGVFQCLYSFLPTHPSSTAPIHKHTMPKKRHADSMQDKKPRKRRKLSADEVLVEAARNGDTTAVRAVLEKLNLVRKKVALDAAHEACRGNHDECLTLLLPYVETTQMGFGILLSECVHADHVACTEVLLQHWKCVCNNVAFVRHGSKHSAGEEDDCPAMWSDPAVCRVLIDAGADIDTNNNAGRSPLHYACDSGALEVVKMLVEAGARVRATDDEGRTCLMLAACSGHTETVRYLVSLPEVELNQQDIEDNETALHVAVQKKATDVVQVLIDAGADIDIQNNEDESLLHAACDSGALDIVKMLVRAGTGVRAVDDQGRTCLMLAACSGHTETVRYLLCLPEVEVNYLNLRNSYTALHHALDEGETDMVQVLIDAGADIDTQNNDGCSPLHDACALEAPGVVKMLIEAGADVRATDDEGRTYLMLAAYYGCTETVRYLVGLPEVDVNHQNATNNHTALQYAVRRGDIDVVQVLIDAGAEEVARVKN